MYTFLLMVMDYIESRNLRWFMVFFLFILLRWLVIFVSSFRYREYCCENKTFFTSVIIPVVDEPIAQFREVLESILRQHPDEVVVVVNGPKNPKLLDLCAQMKAQGWGSKAIKTIYTPVPGKRNAICEGLEALDDRSEITLLVDSDTLWADNMLHRLLMPFSADEAVGGVTTRQKINRPNRSLTTMFANLLEEIRAEGTLKAMSAAGKVGCLPGRTIAFRTAILRAVLPEFLSERFMGIHKEISDDRSLTNLTLRLGYKTVLQDSAVVYTDAPVTWRAFFRQQLRWAEGSQYYNLYMTPWMLRNSWLMLFIYWTDMLMPILLLSVYATIVGCWLVGLMGHHVAPLHYPTALPATLLLIVLGSALGFGTRNIKILRSVPAYYILLFPVFTLILSVFMVAIRVLGLMHCADDSGWRTRNVSAETSSEEVSV